MIFGIDTASVAGNKRIDWQRAKAEGPISFAILRSNYGTGTDRSFKAEWDRVAEAGLVRGAYLFLCFPRKGKAVQDHRDQARAMVATIGRLERGDLPPVLDVEFPGDGRRETGLDARTCLQRCVDAWNILAGAFSRPPIVYTSARVWRDDLDNLPAPELALAPLWLARYPFKAGPARRDAAAFAGGRHDPPVPPPWKDQGNWWMHQYQGNASELPGFSGMVDMNRFNPMLPGERGARVSWVQRRLGVVADGVYGDWLKSSLTVFQKARGLVPDGIVGPRTFAHLCH